ncbi:hypothetical protein R6Z07M_001769 [Ovis aries]
MRNVHFSFCRLLKLQGGLQRPEIMLGAHVDLGLNGEYVTVIGYLKPREAKKKMRVRIRTSRNYDSQNPPDKTPFPTGPRGAPPRNCALCPKAEVRVSLAVESVPQRVEEVLRIVYLQGSSAKPPEKKDFTAAAKDQLSKCRKSEWVTSSEKYVELISTRSEEPRARRRLELLSPGNWQRLGFRGASASEWS